MQALIKLWCCVILKKYLFLKLNIRGKKRRKIKLERKKKQFYKTPNSVFVFLNV